MRPRRETAPGTPRFPHAAIASAFDVPQPLPCEAEQPAIAVDFSLQQRVNGAARKAVSTPDAGPSLGAPGAAVRFAMINVGHGAAIAKQRIMRTPVAQVYEAAWPIMAPTRS